MAKLSTTKKIAIEEMPSEHQPWLGKVLTPLNKFLEQTFFAVNKGLTIADNLKAEKFDLKISTNQVFPMKINWTINERPTAVFLGHITEDNGAPGTIPVHSMQWQFNNGSIELTFNGLEITKAYRATIIGIV